MLLQGLLDLTRSVCGTFTLAQKQYASFLFRAYEKSFWKSTVEVFLKGEGSGYGCEGDDRGMGCSESHDVEELVDKIHQMQSVLEKGGCFSGINRKVVWPFPPSFLCSVQRLALFSLGWHGGGG